MTGTDGTSDVLIIGGGVIGLVMALEARRRYPTSRVTLIKKEQRCGIRASGRDSGVLHAGFYYTADSLNARFTRAGNRRLTEYCTERRPRINRCGKLVVARHAGDLMELLWRGKRNGVTLREITEREANKIEPRVRIHGKALFSPATSSIDPGDRRAGDLARLLRPIAGYAKILADFDVRLEFDVICSNAWRRLAAEHPVPCAT